MQFAMSWMRISFVTFVLIVGVCVGRKVCPCELAEALKKANVTGQLGDWVCMVKYLSNFNTGNRTFVNDPVKRRIKYNHGIFQINSLVWCYDKTYPHPKTNVCKKDCSVFLNDDIKDDIKCASTMYKKSSGFAAWPTYKQYCQGKNNTYWIRNCDV